MHDYQPFREPTELEASTIARETQRYAVPMSHLLGNAMEACPSPSWAGLGFFRAMGFTAAHYAAQGERFATEPELMKAAMLIAFSDGYDQCVARLDPADAKG